MEWIKIIALSFTVIIVDEVVKFVFRLFKKENKNDEVVYNFSNSLFFFPVLATLFLLKMK